MECNDALINDTEGRLAKIQSNFGSEAHREYRFESIAQATGAEFSVIPPQNATGNWVKVVQRIPVRIAVKTDTGDPPLRVGMSTSVEIDTGHRRELPAFVQAAASWFGANATPTAAAAEARP